MVRIRFGKEKDLFDFDFFVENVNRQKIETEHFDDQQDKGPYGKERSRQIFHGLRLNVSQIDGQQLSVCIDSNQNSDRIEDFFENGQNDADTDIDDDRE